MNTRKGVLGPDPKTTMIQAVEEEAARSGAPLTSEERSRLENSATEETVLGLEDAIEHRLKDLVASVIANEKRSGYAVHPSSFVNAIGPAGEREYPLVVKLAEDQIRAPERTFLRKWWAPILLASTIILLLLFDLALSIPKRQ